MMAGVEYKYGILTRYDFSFQFSHTLNLREWLENKSASFYDCDLKFELMMNKAETIPVEQYEAVVQLLEVKISKNCTAVFIRDIVQYCS